MRDLIDGEAELDDEEDDESFDEEGGDRPRRRPNIDDSSEEEEDDEDEEEARKVCRTWPQAVTCLQFQTPLTHPSPADPRRFHRRRR